MLTGYFVLVLWFADRPEYFGQYQTNEQCWQVVHHLLEHGIGSDTGVKFSCYDAQGR